MGVKFRLSILNFLEFFIWGAWLISFGGYLIVTHKFSGTQVGGIYATMGIASMFMPGLLGIVADRWINAEKILGICHLIGSGLLFMAAQISDPEIMFYIMLIYALVYMPTIALSNTVSFTILEKKGANVIKEFPPIRVWGTIGFIIAMWVVDIGGWTISPIQLYISALASILLGLYSFSLPSCPPSRINKNPTLFSALGLDAFVLFKQRRMAIFFIFSLLLGAALQITNTFGEPFLHDFGDEFKETFAVQHPGLLMSVSQISETVFILTIPFFLHRFGIKKVMLMSMFAWVFRFGLFAFGDPGDGFPLLILSMIIYGMAFDFFNVSGSLFVEKEAPSGMRASAQGLFMIMTNGIGAFLGGVFSGRVVDYFTINEIKQWPQIWLVFGLYAFILGVSFSILFKYKHKNNIELKSIHH